MLVYAKNPHGMLTIDGRRIYGIAMVQGPTNVSFELYQRCQDALISATYREGNLQKLFGCRFPEIAFRYDEIKHLPDGTLHMLMKRMSIGYEEEWPKKRKVELIKTALRNA